MRPTLLIVDPDVDARAALASSLETSLGARTRQTSTVLGALAAVREDRFDVAILDAELPDGDGRDLCQMLRARGLTMPILMLSTLSQEADIVRGLDAGANDWLIKPFRAQEIAARVRAQRRHFDSGDNIEMRVGNFIFRPANKTLHEPGQTRPTRLTEKESAVLKYLHRATGTLVTREDLLADVWGYNITAATHTVETHVYRLRLKIEPRADSPRILLHDRGGYRLLRLDLIAPDRLVDRPMDRSIDRPVDAAVRLAEVRSTVLAA